MAASPVPVPPQLDPLALLIELGGALHSTLDLDALLASILKQVQRAVRSEDSALWFIQPNRAELKCTHALGPRAQAMIDKTLPAETVLAAYQHLDRRAVRIDVKAVPPTWAAPFVDCCSADARQLLIAFLIARGELLGLLGLINKLDQTPFTETDADLLAALAGHAAIAIQNAQLLEQQRRIAERQSLLDQISRFFQQTLDIDDLMQRVFAEVNKALDAEAQSIWLLNPDAGNIECRFAVGPQTEQVKKVTVPVGQGIVGASVEKQESIIIADAQQDPRFFRGADAKTGLLTRSLLCVPLVLEGKSIGAIEAINKRNGAPFTRDDLDLLRSIADSAALAIQNAELYTELAASYNSTLDALAAALDLRDRETEGHSRRVVEYTARLARQMGLDESTIATIRRGALIHDIGKIGVPDAVLHKPGPLDPDERKIIEQHPQAGYEMLLDIPHLQEEIKIVLGHQERWDGAGYPYQRRGEAIPLGARLFAIADTLDAIISDRPYRKGRPYSAARQIIGEEAGKQFDPKAVEAFLEIPPQDWDQIRTQVMSEISQRLTAHAENLRRHKAG